MRGAPLRCGRMGVLAGTLLASTVLTACGGGDEPPTTYPKGTIAAIMAADDRFDVLMRILEQDAPAIVLQSLASTDTDITWFAPTDEAFAALPQGLLDALLSDDERIEAVLDHHTIRGVYSSAELEARAREGGRLGTIAGALIELRLSNGELKVDDAKVVEGDIEATNGVIHVVDAVLIPEFIHPSVASTMAGG